MATRYPKEEPVLGSSVQGARDREAREKLFLVPPAGSCHQTRELASKSVPTTHHSRTALWAR